MLNQEDRLSTWRKAMRAIAGFLSPKRSKPAIHPCRHDDQASNIPHVWTDTHSWYAAMGGFVVTATDQARLQGQSYARMAVTVLGIKVIAKYEPEILATISESTIQDKSKANIFVKLLTCSQALWFCTQCITRAAQGLSVSLLEISTAAHAICALVLYFFFWWNKPLDVDEGTPLSPMSIQQAGAFLTVCNSRSFGGRYLFTTERDKRFTTEHESSSRNGLPAHIYSPDSLGYPTPDDQHFQESATTPGSLSCADNLAYQFFVTRWSNSDSPATKEEVALLKLASEFARKHGISGDLAGCLDELGAEGGRERLLLTRIRNTPKDYLLSGPHRTPQPEVWQTVFFRGLLVTSCFYGCFHLLAWQHVFRTAAEKLLWKLSSLTIATLAFGYFLTLFSMNLVDIHFSGRQKGVCSRIIALLNVLMLFFYTICRVFIIIECFLDIFHLPESAFEVPRWSQYFPHIT
jgi:hypothetical protein